MNTTQVFRHIIIGASFTLLAASAAGQAQAANKPVKAVAAVAPESGLNTTASGAVEDDLEHCLRRIPKDASAGQRMMAEQGCGRDQETRKSLDAVPGR